jgi:hypothetical protein
MTDHRHSSTLCLLSLCASALRASTLRASALRASALRRASALSRAILCFFAFLLLSIWSAPVAAQGWEYDTTPVCFWSPQGPVCVERAAVVAVDAGDDLDRVLTALMAGPTARERAQGIWSAIPERTVLAEAGIDPHGTITVRLHVPPDALQHLDPLA